MSWKSWTREMYKFSFLWILYLYNSATLQHLLRLLEPGWLVVFEALGQLIKTAFLLEFFHECNLELNTWCSLIVGYVEHFWILKKEWSSRLEVRLLVQFWVQVASHAMLQYHHILLVGILECLIFHNDFILVDLMVFETFVSVGIKSEIFQFCNYFVFLPG